MKSPEEYIAPKDFYADEDVVDMAAFIDWTIERDRLASNKRRDQIMESARDEEGKIDARAAAALIDASDRFVLLQAEAADNGTVHFAGDALATVISLERYRNAQVFADHATLSEEKDEVSEVIGSDFSDRSGDPEIKTEADTDDTVDMSFAANRMDTDAAERYKEFRRAALRMKLHARNVKNNPASFLGDDASDSTPPSPETPDDAS